MQSRDGRRPVLKPLTPAPKLTHGIIERLASEILSGRLAPGARLPTEQEMVDAMGVSRTVVREAVAALRADGLVETRQGAGAFVGRELHRRPYRLDSTEVRSIAEVLNVMELRTGVEVEAAGMAAERISGASRQTIERALNALDAALRRGEAAVEEDFAFHLAIARAARNPQFARFLEFLGHFLIPRQSIRIGLQQPQPLRTYLERIQAEHRHIFEAICSGDAGAARRSMRQHLMRSRRRYQSFASSGTPIAR